MPKRYLSIWFPALATDCVEKKEPQLRQVPWVRCSPEHGRMVIRAANARARREGLAAGMVLADARAICPQLQDRPYDEPALEQLLQSLADWCLRFTPVVATHPPDSLLLDISGCAHLWGGEAQYLHHISTRLHAGAYAHHLAIADTIGAAWAWAHFGNSDTALPSGSEADALWTLPPAALRLPAYILQRLHKVGLQQIGQFIQMPPRSLQRRFGQILLQRLGQALGSHPESIEPIQPIQPYAERLPCLEPVRTALSIEWALQELLEKICQRLIKENKGLRTARLNAYRVDGELETISIGTGHASHNAGHLFRLFSLKINQIEPALGIELFELEASSVEIMSPAQDTFWNTRSEHTLIAELLDNIATRVGPQSIKRYLPQARHWPEQSLRVVHDIQQQPDTPWNDHQRRPIHLLAQPEPIEVVVPLPDYPPLTFIHRGKAYSLSKADGPERIEREWWVDSGEPRDYYCVEDAEGARYWIFRLGHYDTGEPEWYLHGFFS